MLEDSRKSLPRRGSRRKQDSTDGQGVREFVHLLED